MSTRAVIDVIRGSEMARVRMTWDGTPEHVREMVRRLGRSVLRSGSARQCAVEFVRADCAWHVRCLDAAIRRTEDRASRKVLDGYRKVRHSQLGHPEHDTGPLEACTFEDHRFRLVIGRRGGCRLAVVQRAPESTGRGGRTDEQVY